MSLISIVVADANPMACELLREAIVRHDTDFNVVASATLLSEVLDAVQSAPDVILLGESLGDSPLSGFAALRDLRSLQPAARVVMLLNSSDRDAVLTAFRGGAKGLFVRRHSVNLLCKCIRKVYEGEIWATHAELEFLLDAVSSSLPMSLSDQRAASLTKREEQIVQFVAQGFMNREISRRLNLSEHTVKNYLFRIYEKVGVSTRVELTLWVIGRAENATQKQVSVA